MRLKSDITTVIGTTYADKSASFSTLKNMCHYEKSKTVTPAWCLNESITTYMGIHKVISSR